MKEFRPDHAVLSCADVGQFLSRAIISSTHQPGARGLIADPYVDINSNSVRLSAGQHGARGLIADPHIDINSNSVRLSAGLAWCPRTDC